MLSRTTILLLLGVAAVGIISLPPNSHATQTAVSPADQAAQRIRELQRETDRLAARARTLLDDLRRLELEREIRVEALKKADAELAEVTRALARASARVAELEARRVASSAGVRERLVEIYKRGRSGYVRLLLAADDLRALGRLSRAVAAVARVDRLRIEEHRRAVAAERDAIAELEQRKQAMSAAQTEARAARAALDAAVAAQNRRIDDVDRQRDLAAQYVGELQAAMNELGRRVATMPTTSASPLPLGPFRGALPWPVTGRIVSSFGRNVTRRGAIDRNGIEISAQEGRDVRAVHGGTVSFAAPFVGFGTLVIVDHGASNYTLYGHLQEAVVNEGARVEQGSVVGRAGRNPEGAEVVYFEVRVDGRPVNPVEWLTRR
jgi:septal ring factor EnvC (AmiA/AmiB activator)